MALAPGTRLGPYAITASIGAGGMGEVYKATDTRLDRTIAIKVLPEHVASDPALKQRFEREAKTLAALSHPHICPVFDVGSQNGIDFLVMEYLEGETLEQRLKKGTLPPDQALQFGIQMADALAAAHRAGIVHRDLKPGNIMLTKSGAKLLDFGLAKAGAPTVVGSLSMLPTTPPNLTAQGAILGTFQYMAPEQLEGQDADARTDIFAFGVVLYEMVTGRKAFEGKSQASLIGAILKDTPPSVTSLRVAAPPALDRLIAGCLAKNPEDRWQAAHDVLLQLRAIFETSAAPMVQVIRPIQRRIREKLPWAAAALGLLVAAGSMTSRSFEPLAPDLGAIQFGIDAAVSSGSGVASLAISPDGRRVVLEGPYSPDFTRQLWLRSLDSPTAQPLPGTQGNQLSNPFWSPDSRFIGFFADGKLKIVSVSGGPVRTLCDAPNGGDASWSRESVILFGSARSPLYRVSADGGTPVAVTSLDGMEIGHIRPHFMPDGRHFTFLATTGQPDMNRAYIGTLDSPERRQLDGVASPPTYAQPGFLIFARSGGLMALPFDADRLEEQGEPLPLGEVRQNSDGVAVFSVSATGVLVYQPASASQETRLFWLTRDGNVVASFPPRPGIHTLSLAPDQDRAIVEERGSLWLLDGRRGTASRFTTDSSGGVHPLWSADGLNIAFTGDSAGQRRNTILIKPATGVTEAEPVLQTPTGKQLTDWSLDGRTLIFEEQSAGNGWNIGAVAVTGERAARSLIQSRFQERMGSLSPDGRYLAYTSDETGRAEIYVVTYPNITDKWTVSTGGGTAPRWRRDGNELFFVDPAGMLTSVPVIGRNKFEVGSPKPLFDLQAIPTDGFNYAVSTDGQRFLVARPTDSATVPLTVIVNWPALLRK